MRSYHPNFRANLDPKRLRTYEASKKIREDFYDAPVRKVEPVSWTWPTKMIYVGECLGEMYASKKWKEPQPIDYKHNAEGKQYLYCRPGFIVDYFSERGLPGLKAETVDVGGDMPDSFAVLDRCMSLQARLNGLDDDYQIDITGAWIGAAKHPGTDETFLIVYTDGKSNGLKPEVHCIITGEILGVEKDGIVG